MDQKEPNQFIDDSEALALKTLNDLQTKAFTEKTAYVKLNAATAALEHVRKWRLPY